MKPLALVAALAWVSGGCASPEARSPNRCWDVEVFGTFHRSWLDPGVKDSLLVGGCDVLGVETAQSGVLPQEGLPWQDSEKRSWAPAIVLSPEAVNAFRERPKRDDRIAGLSVRIGSREARGVVFGRPQEVAIPAVYLYARDSTYRLQFGFMSRREAERIVSEADTARAAR